MRFLPDQQKTPEPRSFDLRDTRATVHSLLRIFGFITAFMLFPALAR